MSYDRNAVSGDRLRRAGQRLNVDTPFIVGSGVELTEAGVFNVLLSDTNPALAFDAAGGLKFLPDPGSGLTANANGAAINLIVNGTGQNISGLRFSAGKVGVRLDTATNLASLGVNGLLVSNVLSVDLKLGTAGNGFYVKEGTNATMGTAVLVAGIVTVNTTKVTANSRVFLSRQVAGGVHGNLSLANVVAGTSFDIASDTALDKSTVGWLIVEPA
jgi:hypothetical protein